MSTKKPIRVKKWISSGELNSRNRTQASILDDCGRLLDESCSHEILGEVLFQATNGKHYVITVEAMIQEASTEYVKDMLSRKEE